MSGGFFGRHHSVWFFICTGYLLLNNACQRNPRGPRFRPLNYFTWHIAGSVDCDMTAGQALGPDSVRGHVSLLDLLGYQYRCFRCIPRFVFLGFSN